MCRPLTREERRQYTQGELREQEMFRHKQIIERHGQDSDMWRNHVKLHRTSGSEHMRLNEGIRSWQ